MSTLLPPLSWTWVDSNSLPAFKHWQKIKDQCYTPCFPADSIQSPVKTVRTSLIAMELTSGISWTIFEQGIFLSCLIPDDKLPVIRKEILEEAEFYQIRGIVNQLHPPPFLGSKILSDEQKQFILNSCLKGQLDLRHSSFVLIYRASRDGWEYVNFHAHCDNKGPTVTVVKSGNYIFGGYTEQSWNGKHSSYY